MNIFRKLFRRLNRFCEKKIESIYRQSKVRFIYRTEFGISTYVHPEKLIDIIKSNTSCDAAQWMNALQDVLPPMEVVIDIGANIGIVSCWLSRKSHIVYSFEPEQLNINFLQKNIQLNDIKNIEIVPFAVGAYDGATDFFIRDSFGHHGIKSKHITKVVDIRQVPMVRLDSFCREKLIDRISFLKIDVEGGELDVLQGFDEYLTSKKVDMVLFEHAPVLFNTDEEKVAVFDYLTSRDYLIFDIDHKKLDRSTMVRIQQGDFYAKPV